jgi:hypothetical protein
MPAATPEPWPERSAPAQTSPRASGYRPRLRVCGYCGTADNGTNPRHIFTSDDDRLRLCRVCIAACVDIVDDFYMEGRT